MTFPVACANQFRIPRYRLAWRRIGPRRSDSVAAFSETGRDDRVAQGWKGLRAHHDGMSELILKFLQNDKVCSKAVGRSPPELLLNGRSRFSNSIPGQPEREARGKRPLDFASLRSE